MVFPYRKNYFRNFSKEKKRVENTASGSHPVIGLYVEWTDDEELKELNKHLKHIMNYHERIMNYEESGHDLLE